MKKAPKTVFFDASSLPSENSVSSMLCRDTIEVEHAAHDYHL